MENNKLSVIIPAYNEKNTIREIIKQIEEVSLPLDKEIIIIDDGSSDGTSEILAKMDRGKYKIVFKKKNEGKGAAVKTGFKIASGDVIIIQDADLEYNPSDYRRLLEPIISGKADVVYGSRFLGADYHRVLYFWHYLGNKFITTLSNMFTNLNLSDMECCYKAFRRKVVDSFKDKLSSKRFGIEPEITAYIAKGKWRIFEIGVSYNGRTYEEGKKVNWQDGLAAVWHIIKFNVFKT